MEYKIGDKVLLKSEIDDNMRSWWGSHPGGMDIFLGAVVTISGFGGSGRHGTFVSFEENNDGWSFYTNCIEGIATPELVEEVRIKKEKERAKLLKAGKKYLYDSERVGAIATDIFGEDRVFIENDEKGDNWDISIYFPEIKMTNSKKEEHVIKNLYVVLRVKPDVKNFLKKDVPRAYVEFGGIRSSFSLKEWDRGYSHSHLPSRCIGQYSSFCTGSSAFRTLLMDVMENLSEDAWTSLFLSIPPYLSWESIEGGPHIRIEDIRYSNAVSGDVVMAELSRICGNIPTDVWDVGGDSVTPIRKHERIYEFFNQHSKIRSLCGYSEEQLEEKLEEANIKIKKTFLDKKIQFKGEPVVPYIEIEKEERKNISTDVVDQYCDILARKGKSFLKQKKYNELREKNSSRTFNKAGVVEQACVSDNEGVEEEDRLLAS